jgi:hypothetical protein
MNELYLFFIPIFLPVYLITYPRFSRTCLFFTVLDYYLFECFELKLFFS